ncbi:class I SAM-dependent methyltransferase [Algoriphagus hitonicola]|uniref:Methyltransferase domain-containing protein n=1 Tax=Algoriphagus hitonicola TaxID=435880 RepID=A0A1I2VLP7_9BACT|nr:class I SAM-dependent methyltransferase [Algoriphagus hitonicola]SFG90254.1 Methyltransferase domain-containing protein [Algoriphagus hitonicola]
MSKAHINYWDFIYDTKDSTQVGWYQALPAKSLAAIQKVDLKLDADILDVGGGDSLLVDKLNYLGYQNLHVLDLSKNALENAQDRLGEAAKNVHWYPQNILDGFAVDLYFDFWHDRAAFHFLTDPMEQILYREIAAACINPGGYLMIHTFSPDGPKTCSNLPVRQWSVGELTRFFEADFQLFEGFNYDHFTPAGKAQNYSVVILKRRLEI